MRKTMNSLEFITVFLLILFIIICNAPSEVLAINKLYRDMMKGEEIKVATYQVSFQTLKIEKIYHSIVFFLYNIHQFPPIFEYKKSKDGNYTYEGLLYELTLRVQEYSNFRFK